MPIPGQLLEVDDVRRSFGQRQALDGVSFSVAPGEVFGFVGSNGAGKTTTMRVILGVLTADSGEVRSGGIPLGRSGRRRIGYMPEEHGLYPRMRVGEILAYVAALRGASTARARQQARQWAERLGVAERLGDEVQHLSLGNRQRVQLAAALVHDPDLLVLDEPFSGLDPVTADVLGTLLRHKSAEGVPVIFSSHQLDLVERTCDRAGIIGHGRMIAFGTVADLRGRVGRQVVLDVPPQADARLARLPGVRVCGRSDRLLTLEIEAGADDQRVLVTALEAGPVHAFTPRSPSLNDVFRDLVTQDAADTGEGN